MITWPGADGPDQIIDDGSDTIMLIHKGKEFEERVAKDGLSPRSKQHHQARVQVPLSDNQGLSGVDPKTWTKRAVVVMGVSEETSTGVHRLTEMADKGELLFPLHAMTAEVHGRR